MVVVYMFIGYGDLKWKIYYSKATYIRLTSYV